MPGSNKKGPGRGPSSRHRTGQKRLNARTVGGNWQGTKYVSYAEHDARTRVKLALRPHG